MRKNNTTLDSELTAQQQQLEHKLKELQVLKGRVLHSSGDSERVAQVLAQIERQYKEIQLKIKAPQGESTIKKEPPIINFTRRPSLNKRNSIKEKLPLISFVGMLFIITSLAIFSMVINTPWTGELITGATIGIASEGTGDDLNAFYDNFSNALNNSFYINQTASSATGINPIADSTAIQINASVSNAEVDGRVFTYQNISLAPFNLTANLTLKNTSSTFDAGTSASAIIGILNQSKTNSETSCILSVNTTGEYSFSLTNASGPPAQQIAVSLGGDASAVLRMEYINSTRTVNCSLKTSSGTNSITATTQTISEEFGVKFAGQMIKVPFGNPTGDLNATFYDFNYSLSSGDSPTISACGNVGAGSYELDRDINTTSGTCLNITAASVTIDCKAYNITYGSTAGYAIDTNEFNHIAIKNCEITNNGTASSSWALWFDNSDNVTAQNNTILPGRGPGSGGIYFSTGNISLFESNTITTWMDNGHGIRIADSNYSNVFSNTITIQNTTTAYGIYLSGSANDNSLTNNTIRTANGNYSILDETGNSYINNLTYSNSNGQIVWSNMANGSFRKNLTLSGNIGLDVNLTLSSDMVAVNTSAFNIGKINTSANITFYGLTLAAVNSIEKDPFYQTTGFSVNGTECVDLTCTIFSYNGSTLRFNTTSFSSFAPNTLPTIPVLLIPATGNATVNRTPGFTWNNSIDDNNDTITYNLVIDDNAAFNNPEINVSSITNNTRTNTTYDLTTELNVDTTFFWKVRAYDNIGYSNFSSTRNFTVDSYIAISLLQDTVNFGNIRQGAKNSTTDNLPQPFLAENIGNILVNITITGTRWFTSVSFPSFYYQFKIDVNESNSFNTSGSTTDWKNMTNSSSAKDVLNLDWHNGNDTFEAHLNITVPSDELVGLKNSTVTFTVG